MGLVAVDSQRFLPQPVKTAVVAVACLMAGGAIGYAVAAALERFFEPYS